MKTRYYMTIVKTGEAGPPGENGEDGGISSETSYQTSSSGTTPPTGTWHSTPTSTSPGQFLWTKTVITYTDSSTTTSYSVAAHGLNGQHGDDGRGISSTDITYQVDTNGTTPPTTWKTTIPLTSPGEFLWTKTVITYTDSSTTISYSVAAHGQEEGKDGIDGRGISSTDITYQVHTNGTTPPTTWGRQQFLLHLLVNFYGLRLL